MYHMYRTSYLNGGIWLARRLLENHFSENHDMKHLLGYSSAWYIESEGQSLLVRSHQAVPNDWRNYIHYQCYSILLRRVHGCFLFADSIITKLLEITVCRLWDYASLNRLYHSLLYIIPWYLRDQTPVNTMTKIHLRFLSGATWLY